MEKLKRKILKHDNIIMFFLMLLLSSSFLLAVPLDANDELWNFSNIYKMVNGYQIYEDLNVIITPLFFYLGKIILEILGANYFAFRVYGVVVLNTCVFFLIYQIFKKLKMQKINSIFFAVFFMIIQLMILLNGFYNYLAIFFVLLGVFWELKVSEDKKYKSVVQGLITFLIFLSKQNVVILYLLGRILYFLLKQEKKEWKKMCLELATSVICLILFLIYMYITNRLSAFLDYTVGGLKEFSKNNMFGSIIGIITIIAEIGISIFVIWMAKNKKMPLQEQERNHILLLTSISLPMLGIAYPIFNTAHVFIASVIFIVMIVYVLDLLIFKPLLFTKKINRIKKWLILIAIFTLLGGNLWYNIQKMKTLEEFSYEIGSPYYGVLVEEEKRKEIDEILQYINKEEQAGRDVKIISYYANLYMNLLGRNNGEMDLPFYGNLGGDGENGLIEQIKQLKNTKILILTQEDTIYQESKKVMNYIKENYPKEGEIRQFSIYYAE